MCHHTHMKIHRCVIIHIHSTQTSWCWRYIIIHVQSTQTSWCWRCVMIHLCRFIDVSSYTCSAHRQAGAEDVSSYTYIAHRQAGAEDISSYTYRAHTQADAEDVSAYTYEDSSMCHHTHAQHTHKLVLKMRHHTYMKIHRCVIIHIWSYTDEDVSTYTHTYFMCIYHRYRAPILVYTRHPMYTRPIPTLTSALNILQHEPHIIGIGRLFLYTQDTLCAFALYLH